MIIQTTTNNVVEKLSFTEMKLVKALYEEMRGYKEKNIIAKNIAEKEGASTSSINFTLRILEIANVISVKSVGMRGSLLTVLNKEAFKAICGE